jgi:cytidine deaminase
MELTKEEEQKLIQEAMQIRKNAYAPYSNYQVGAALMTEDGKIFTGVNVENSSYPISMCAERSAIFTAVGVGEKRFKAIAIATINGGPPCGGCRQVMSEFSPDMIVITVDETGKICMRGPVHEILPGAFGPKNLE